MEFFKWVRRYLWLVILCAVIFGPDAWHSVQMHFQERRVDQRLAVLDADFEHYQQEKERLTEDDTYIEGMIRSTFKYSRPNEVVIPLKAENE